MFTTLDRAIAAIRDGDKATGKRLLIEALKANSNSDTAWVWMAEVCPSERRQECIERALAINPNNEMAQRAMAKLNRPMPSPVVVVQAPQPAPMSIPTKTCPWCKATIPKSAAVCMYCGHRASRADFISSNLMRIGCALIILGAVLPCLVIFIGAILSGD